MNSLRMYVEDAVGGRFLFTCATNRPEQKESFRRHARWWINSGYRQTPVAKQPAFPCRIVVEEYQDDTAT